MKEQIKKIIEEFGCKCYYSGNDKTMYISGDNAVAAKLACKILNPPFALLVNEKIVKDNYEDPKKEATV